MSHYQRRNIDNEDGTTNRMDDEDDINMEMVDDDDEDDFDDDDDDDDIEDDMTDTEHPNNSRSRTNASSGGRTTTASGGTNTTSTTGSSSSTTARPATTGSAARGDDDDEPPAEEAAAIARRRAIQQIMRDTSLTEQEKRFRVQQLMSQNRLVVVPAPSPVLPSQMNAANTTTDSNGVSVTNNNAACVHYERNCNIVAPCCNRVFGCRICHDELSPVGHPPMNRFEIHEVICKNCQTRQSSKSNQCTSCKTVFGEYYCGICNLWMSKARKPFHCYQCGFCRVGGEENFRHCIECCMCIAASVFNTHQCLKDKYKNNCPVCHDDMFSSRQAPQDLPCGHAIHAHCFRKLAGFDYRCPICKKTVVSQQSMAAAWEARARDIAEHTMPADLQRVVDIICNDCEVRSHRQQWHFLGIQCPGCSSFNTVVEQVVSSGGPDADSAETNLTDNSAGA